MVISGRFELAIAGLRARTPKPLEEETIYNLHKYYNKNFLKSQKRFFN